MGALLSYLFPPSEEKKVAKDPVVHTNVLPDVEGPEVAEVEVEPVKEVGAPLPP